MDFKNAMDLMGKDSHLGNHFCSGMCNVALKSTSTVCANNALETHVKTIAEDDLLYCSSCEHLSTTISVTFARVPTMSNAAEV